MPWNFKLTICRWSRASGGRTKTRRRPATSPWGWGSPRPVLRTLSRRRVFPPCGKGFRRESGRVDAAPLECRWSCTTDRGSERHQTDRDRARDFPGTPCNTPPRNAPPCQPHSPLLPHRITIHLATPPSASPASSPAGHPCILAFLHFPLHSCIFCIPASPARPSRPSCPQLRVGSSTRPTGFHPAVSHPAGRAPARFRGSAARS
jgi:hypothetical protein